MFGPPVKYIHRHARCRPCNVVFRWPIKFNIRVSDAWCPRCRGKLRQTATALLDTSKTQIVDISALGRENLAIELAAPPKVNVL